MKRYQEIQKESERKGTIVALAATVLVHALLVVVGLFTGLKYIYPPPEEQTFLIDYSEPENIPVRVRQERHGAAPHAENPDKSKPINLVQRSEGQEKGSKENLAKEATVDDFGDVEKYEPPREKPIERRALFHAANNSANKDTLAAQTASKVSNALKAGHAQGNTENGKTSGKPNAQLKGRRTVGNIPYPAYEVQNYGTVVVEILVDQYGTVKKATPGAPGTNVNDSKLWAAARTAALNTHFNMDGDAPAIQKGTITYNFILTK